MSSRFWRRLRRNLPPLPEIPSGREIRHGLKRNLPPIPRIWSIPRLWQWIKRRPRRYRRFKWLLGFGCAGVVGLLVAKPVSHQVKAWQARRLAAEAATLIDQEDWAGAGRKIHDAFRIWSNEPQVWRVEARLLSRAGQNAEALRWWQRVAEAQPLSLDDHREYAAVALAARDVIVADQQLKEILNQNHNPTGRDLVLAGTLAGLRGYSATALEYADRVLRDPGAGPRDRLGAAVLVFSNSSPNSTAYRRAYAEAVTLARNESENTSLQALAILARQTPPSTGASNAEGLRLDRNREDRTTVSGAPDATMELEEVAQRLEQHPRHSPFHRMLAMEVRARLHPDLAEQLVDEAVQKFGNGDDETLIMLTGWLFTRGKFETILHVLPLDRVIRNRQLFIQRIDALASLKRYSELQDMLLSEQSVIDPSMQHMFLAVVKAKLGETVASDNEWERALDEADDLSKLTTLADYAEKNGAIATADAACARAISKQPDLRWAYTSRLRLAQTLGNTAGAHKVAKEIVRLWPDDMAAKVREIYLRLLLDPSAEAAKQAEQELTEISARNPWDGPTLNALSLARLRQGRMAAALDAAPQPGPGVAASAPLAVAWAANGWKDKAREELRKLSTVKLLPEERALIAPLMSENNR